LSKPYSKGQLIPNVFFWCHHFDQKSNENILRISALKVFIASLGLSVGFLINHMYLLSKPKKLSGSPQEAIKHFRAEIFLLLFWDKLIFHKDIIKLSDL